MLSKKRWDRPHDPLEVRALLVASRSAIASPERWLQGYAAVNRYGIETDPRSDTACRWCALGAILRHDPSLTGDELGPLGQEAVDVLNGSAVCVSPVLAGASEPLVELNDDATHAEVLRVFDLAVCVAGRFGFSRGAV